MSTVEVPSLTVSLVPPVTLRRVEPALAEASPAPDETAAPLPAPPAGFVAWAELAQPLSASGAARAVAHIAALAHPCRIRPDIVGSLSRRFPRYRFDAWCGERLAAVIEA
jgi:hypothetical protein